MARCGQSAASRLETICLLSLKVLRDTFRNPDKSLENNYIPDIVSLPEILDKSSTDGSIFSGLTAKNHTVS